MAEQTKSTNKITPIPMRDDIVGLGTKTLNQPWELWFRKLYDVVVGMSNISSGTNNNTDAGKYSNVSGFNYCLDGNRYFFNYKGTGNVEIILPFPIMFDISYSWGSFSAGQKRIQLPTFENETILNEWFFLSIS